MLPESKDDFPKLLYLDQNKWIDLSRAHYGRPDGETFRDALTAIRRALEAGKLIVPFSAVNIVELEADRRADRRERLARFMVDLSCNRTILPFMPIRSWEIRNAVHAFYERSEPGSIRPSIVREGIANAWTRQFRVTGPSAEVEAAVLQHLNSAETALHCLLDSAEQRELTDQFRAEEATTLRILENVRARCAADGITTEWRLVAELFRYLGGGHVGYALVAVLEEIGISVQSFFDRFATPAEFNQFFANVPTLGVFLTLLLARDQDLLRPIDQNDARDLIWLSVALPYSNLVVSEKYWSHMVRSCRLDRKYGTTILTDARELPGRLEEMGCFS